MSRDEDVDSRHEGGEGPLSQELHLHVYEEVSGLADLPLQVHGPRERVELAGAEVVLLVAAGDADDDVVAGVRGRGPDAEDLGRDDDVGLKAQLVVGDSQRRVLAVQEVRACYALAASGKHRPDTRIRCGCKKLIVGMYKGNDMRTCRCLRTATQHLNVWLS